MKYLFLSLIFFVVLFFTPVFSHVQAASTKVVQDPNPATTATSNVSFTVSGSNNEDIFSLNNNYGFKIINKSTGKDCYLGQITKASDTKSFTVNYPLSTVPLCSTAGGYTFQLALNSDFSNSDNLIATYDYEVQGNKGGIVSIRPLNSPIGVSEKPKVLLINARKDNYYTFWWNGSKIEKQEIQATGDTNQPIELTQLTLSSTGQIDLCMVEGQHYSPAGLTCVYPAPFNVVSTPPDRSNKGITCQLQPNNVKPTDTVTYVVSGLTPNASYRADKIKNGQVVHLPMANSDASGNLIYNLTTDELGKTQLLEETSYTFHLYDSQNIEIKECFLTANVNQNNQPIPLPECNFDNPKDPNFCASGAGAGCDPTSGAAKVGGAGVLTAVGCVPTEPKRFIAGMMKYVLGFGGGVALLLMIFGSLGMVTSQGSPDAIKKGREQFTNALIGLLFVIFSTLFMQILGVDILGLPGFTK